MKALVTGATGFIGSWLVLELLENDYDIIVIVRDKDRLLPTVKTSPRCQVIEGEIENLLSENIQASEGIDVFFHLAWGGVAPENKNDIELQISNIKLAIKAMELCNSLKCKKFIASGTVAEYVFCDDIMNVNAKQTPNDIYGAAKVSTHFFLDVRARQLYQEYNWVVLPSTFGERRRDNNIITYTITTLLNGEKPLYGDLEQMWDFMYVADVVRAIRLIGERGISGKVYGIGSGNYQKLRSYISAIRDIINPKLELGIGEKPQMSKQSFSSCVNIYDLKKDVGFEPSIGFEKGIKNTIYYFKNQL